MRRVTRDDVPWVRSLFIKRFANYDVDSAESWYVNTVLANPVTWLAIRTDDAYLTAYMRQYPWLPARLECEVVTVCCDLGKIWQAFPLLRTSLEWARERKAASWGYSSDTDYDIGPLVRRLGAHSREPRFIINLEST